MLLPSTKDNELCDRLSLRRLSALTPESRGKPNRSVEAVGDPELRQFVFAPTEDLQHLLVPGHLCKVLLVLRDVFDRFSFPFLAKGTEHPARRHLLGFQRKGVPTRLGTPGELPSGFLLLSQARSEQVRFLVRPEWFRWGSEAQMRSSLRWDSRVPERWRL